MRLIDTNVFIYAVGRPHPYKPACLRVLDALESGLLEANIDAELLQEILYVYWSTKRLGQGVALFDRVEQIFPDLIPIAAMDTRVARELLARHPTIAPRDAIHAAVALNHGLDGVISTDGGFDTIPGITRIDPMEFLI